MLWEHRMEALECFHLAPGRRWLERRQFEWQLDPDVLRKVAHWQATHRWAMAHRRMQAEPYKVSPPALDSPQAKKCLFHGLRYLNFALQLLRHGAIVDYSLANHYLKEIMSHPSEVYRRKLTLAMGRPEGTLQANL